MTSATVIPLDYPVNGAALNRSFPERYPYVLESTASSATENTRYDIIFAYPAETLPWETVRHNNEGDKQDFLAQLNEHWKKAAQDKVISCDLPFSGGWFVYLGYELAQEIEHRLHLPKTQGNLLQAFATRIPVALINDHHLKKSCLVFEYGMASPYDEVVHDLGNADVSILHTDIHADTICEEDASQYLDNVERIKRYIYEGDVFQVNLSRQWSGSNDQENLADALYQKLRLTNPAPFSGIVKYGNQAILSSSPERLVRVRAGNVETRPIAGTRASGVSRKEDERLQTELLENLKERAEHLMLLDLERNDLGRVCQPGSVNVSELMVVEHYAHVQHIVSNVVGKLREDVLPGDVLRAVFPGGTITGCPKERCMAIIGELEQMGRGAYTGSMGYLNHDGSMDMNILIRTIVVDGNTFSFRAGAGIVADSDATNELDETRIKAEGMLRVFRQ